MNELASNIEHKNPNTKKNEAVEEKKKNEESHALVDFIYNSFFSVNKRKRERKRRTTKKPQMK